MIVPTDTDDTDQLLLQELVADDEAIVDGYVIVVSWTDGGGERRWRCFVNSDQPASTNVGLLELAKLDVIARTNTGLPIRYEETGE